MAVSPVITGSPFLWGADYVYNYSIIKNQKPIDISDAKEGMAIFQTIIQLSENGMFDNWQDNQPWIFPATTPLVGTDNPRNLQLGELVTLRVVSDWSRYFYTKEQRNGVEDNRIIIFNTKMSTDSSYWMFPRAQKEYREGLGYLKSYLGSVQSGTVNVYPTANNLDVLMNRLTSNLASDTQRLKKYENLGLFEGIFNTAIDDEFYEAQGNLRATIAVLKAVRIDFKEILLSKKLDDQLKLAIERAESNKSYLADPFIVLTSGFGNDIAQMALLTQTLSSDIGNIHAGSN